MLNGAFKVPSSICLMCMLLRGRRLHLSGRDMGVVVENVRKKFWLDLGAISV